VNEAYVRCYEARCPTAAAAQSLASVDDEAASTGRMAGVDENARRWGGALPRAG